MSKTIGTRRRRQLYRQAVRVRFEDECRAIGCGVRPVVVDRIGPKWVRLVNPYTGTGHKVTRSVWDKLEVSAL